VKRVVVVGLGIFGFNIAKDLFENGFEVVAIDKNKEVINRIRDFSTKAVMAMRRTGTAEMIGIQPEDIVIVSLERTWQPAPSDPSSEGNERKASSSKPHEDHKRSWKVGATEVIIPSGDGQRQAKSLISPTCSTISPCRGFHHQRVASASFLERPSPTCACGDYHIEVIAIRDVLSTRFSWSRADFVIKDSDILIVMGKEADIQKISELGIMKTVVFLPCCFSRSGQP
jgi:trk system potassium uptake protein TrkA